MTSALRLEKITADNVDAACAVTVRAGQERFVESVARSLAEAYVHPDIAWPRLILDGDQPVGFVMAFFDVHFYDTDPPDLLRSGLWRLNIAADHQGHGYGRFAVRAVCDEIRRRGGSRATVTYAPDDDGPRDFYLRLGFHPTGELSGNQPVAELHLPTQSA
ncbi:GNAT family N-acetyltransferase [Longispora sp. NPDC051575]|uniref:GNAT family N-acetyltransferase n=1 Tax=Longispora sp. NPDC051575 TaxID=3154943 RepID=UPI003433DBFA